MNSRRTFLRIIVAGIVAFFLFAWNKLTLNHLEATVHGVKIFPFNKNKTVSFYDNYIVVTRNNSTKVFSSHCTHLGCKIDNIVGERLVCPCHGSEYDLNGEVVKGPAYKNLTIIPSRISEEDSKIIIEG